jgi:hypothetical protein
VVTKTEINSFKGTDLEAKLKAAGVCSPRVDDPPPASLVSDRLVGWVGWMGWNRWTTSLSAAQ